MSIAHPLGLMHTLELDVELECSEAPPALAGRNEAEGKERTFQFLVFGRKQATLTVSPSTPPNSTLNTLSRAEQTHSRSLRAHPRRADPPPLASGSKCPELAPSPPLSLIRSWGLPQAMGVRLPQAMGV